MAIKRLSHIILGLQIRSQKKFIFKMYQWVVNVLFKPVYEVNRWALSCHGHLLIVAQSGDKEPSEI